MAATAKVLAPKILGAMESFGAGNVMEKLAVNSPSIYKAIEKAKILPTTTEGIAEAAGAAAASVPMELGAIYGRQREASARTGNDTNAWGALAMAVPAGFLDAIGIENLMKATRIVGKEATEGIVKRLWTGFKQGAIGEMPTEGLQSVFERGGEAMIDPKVKMLSKDAFAEYLENAVAGGLTGGIFGGAGRMVRQQSTDPHQPKPDQQQPQPPTPTPTRDDLQSVMPENQDEIDELIAAYGAGKDSAPPSPAPVSPQNQLQNAYVAPTATPEQVVQSSQTAQQVQQAPPAQSPITSNVQAPTNTGIAEPIQQVPASVQAPQQPIATEPISQAGANQQPEIMPQGEQPNAPAEQVAPLSQRFIVMPQQLSAKDAKHFGVQQVFNVVDTQNPSAKYTTFRNEEDAKSLASSLEVEAPKPAPVEQVQLDMPTASVVNPETPVARVAPAPRPKQKQPDIRTFFIQRGGISLPIESKGGYSGELKQLREEMGKWEGNKLIRTLKVKGAVSLDDALTVAKEAGYLPEDATLDDLINALREKRQHPVRAEDESARQLEKFDQRKDTATREKLQFLTENELARKEMHQHLIDAGIAEDSDTYGRIMGTFRKAERKPDRVTGWIGRGDFDSIAERMWTEATKDYNPETGEPGRPISYAAIDLVNMGGLNKHLKSESAADSEYIRPTADIIRQALDEAGIDNAVYIRKGGDELSVFAPDTTKEELDKALQNAKMKVWQRSKEKGVAALTHAKTQMPNIGYGIYFGTAQLNHEFDMADVLENSERELYEQKAVLEKGEVNAGGEIISKKAQSGTSTGQAGRVTESTRAPLRGSKEEGRVSESGETQEKDGLSGERDFLEAPAEAPKKQKATQSDMFGVANALEGKLQAESVDLSKDNLFARADTVKAEQNAKEDQERQEGMFPEKEHPILRYAHGETVAMIEGEALEKIAELGFDIAPSPAVITTKTIDHVIERRPNMTNEDVDNLKGAIESPTDIYPNIATEKAPYRANSVLLVKKNGGHYVTIVEITPGVKENIIWNFWKEEKSTFDRYIKKFEAEKTRILQSGGRRTVPHVPLDIATEGKPESLSGSQTKDTRDVFDSNIPQSGDDVKELYAGIHVPTMLKEVRKLNDKFSLGLTNEDLTAAEAMYSIPNWIAKDHPEFLQHLHIEEQRQENREAMLHDMLQSPTKKRAGEHHEYLSLSKEDEAAVSKLIVESDADNRLISKKELQERGITEPQMIAYYAWKRSMDKALDLRIENYKKVSLIPYEDRAYFDDLKKIMDHEGTPIEVRQEALNLAGKMNRANSENFMADVDRLIPDKGTIKELRAQLGELNFYMPRTRGEGEYVARVWSEDGDLLWSERTAHDPKGAAMVMVNKTMRLNDSYTINKRLKKEFPDARIVWKHEPKTAEFMYQEMTDSAIERFLDKTIEKVREGGKVDVAALQEVKDSLKQTLVDDLKSRGFGKHSIHRRKGAPIGGYRTEGLKDVFVSYMSGASGYMSKAEAAMRHHLALQALPNNKPKLMQYAQQYVKDMMRNSSKLDRMSGKLRGMAYTWYLMGNIKFAAVQMTQNYIAAIPELSKHTKGAHRKMHVAMTQVVTEEGLNREEKEALEKAYKGGLVRDQYIKEVTGRTKGKPKQAFEKSIDFLSIPFRRMETFNRKASFLAAYRVARNEQKMSIEDAYEFARQFVNDTQYLMGKANLPAWARGAEGYHTWARTLYTFRSFQHNYMLGLKRNITKEGAAGYKAVALSMAWMMAFGGAGVFFLDELLDILERLLGYPARKIVKDRLKKHGDWVAKVGTQGIPALLGVDLSGSIKMEIPFAKTIFGTGGVSDVYGVYSGLGTKAIRGLQFATLGQIERASESLAPIFIENLMKGYRMMEGTFTNTETERQVKSALGMTGPVTDDKGREILDPETGEQMQLTKAEGIAKMMSFQPARISEKSKEKRIESNLDSSFDDRRRSIYKKYRFAVNTGDDKEIDEVLDQVNKYNDDAADWSKHIAPRITMLELRNASSPKQNRAISDWFATDTTER